MFSSILRFRNHFADFYQTILYFSLTLHLSFGLCLCLGASPGSYSLSEVDLRGKKSILKLHLSPVKPCFCCCCFLYPYTHKHTHALSFSVCPFCTYIRGRERGLAPAEHSSNPIFFERNNSSPYEQPADTASACTCVFGLHIVANS